jgi:hypothetical protein
VPDVVTVPSVMAADVMSLPFGDANRPRPLGRCLRVVAIRNRSVCLFAYLFVSLRNRVLALRIK